MEGPNDSKPGSLIGVAPDGTEIYGPRVNHLIYEDNLERVRVARVNSLKQALVNALIMYHGIIQCACEACNVSRATFNTYVREDSKFADLVIEAREVAIDFVESKLFENIDKGYEASIIFFLKTRAKHRGYIERSESVRNINIKYESLSDDELQQRIETLRRRVAITDGATEETSGE